MMPQRPVKPRRRWFRKTMILLAILALLAGAGLFAAQRWYSSNLKPAGASQKRISVNIPLGSSLHDVTLILKENGLIRNGWVFEQYVRSHNLQDLIQAGSYALQQSQSVEEIVEVITEGKVDTDLVTILPGQRLDQVKRDLIKAGFSEASVTAALDSAQYADHPALTDKPAGANLEGYLYPESFLKTAETTPQQVIQQSLDEMQKRLTPAVRNGIVRQGLTVHEGIILASMVEQEVSNLDDKPKVAQVFLKRIRINMALGSDITAPYGAILDGQTPSLGYDSAYNTHKHLGLPPTPISNVSESSLQAVANPASTDWLFFVAGDDGITYFSKTVEEHEALAAQHCKKLCSL
jgi:UPF0755 protein